MKKSKTKILALALAVVMLIGMMATGASAATHVVSKGDTLWGIAEEYLGSGFKWTEIYEANKDRIKDPNMIFVGQEFVLPGTEEPEVPVELEPIEVNVTISDKGEVVVAKETVSVTDIDGDGAYTVNDVLYAAHESAYEGGAEAGYASYTGDYGLAISKLWGDDSAVCGYWLNNASCWSLADVVADGDYVVAFNYADTTGWSDAYSCFAENSYTATAGEAVTVTLNSAGYDESWNTVFSGYAGAALTAEGATVVDNGDGTYAVTFAAAGTYKLVATAENNAIVPAIVEVTVEAPSSIEVNVTIVDKGEVVVAKETVTVTDVDGDGAYTVNDVLYAAHESAYEGGAEAGYASYTGDYGLAISKLWGDDSAICGYWLNHASCWSLADVVTEGGYVVAFNYADTTGWSDSYARFAQDSYTATAGEAVVVTLESAGYDESWNTVFSACAGAALIAEGATVVDNGDGTYCVTFALAGTYTLIASTENNTIVPAVVVVEVQ